MDQLEDRPVLFDHVAGLCIAILPLLFDSSQQRYVI